MLANVGLPVVDERTGVAGDEVDSRYETGIYDPFDLLLGYSLCLEESDGLVENSKPELLLDEFEGEYFFDDLIELVVVIAFVPADEVDLVLAELDLVLLLELLQVLVQVVRVDLIHLLQLHVRLLELLRADRLSHLPREHYAPQNQRLLR